MASSPYHDEERKPLNQNPSSPEDRNSLDSLTPSSDTSIALEHLNHDGSANGNGHTKAPPLTIDMGAKSDD